MWFFLAFGAATLWGVSYTLSEELYRHISVLTLLAIEFSVSAIVFTLLAINANILKTDFATLSSSGRIMGILVVCVATLIVAELCINFSISNRNATVSSLIEISYPFFVVLFSWLLLRENNLNAGTLIGGLLVFAGVASIYLFNR